MEYSLLMWPIHWWDHDKAHLAEGHGAGGFFDWDDLDDQEADGLDAKNLPRGKDQRPEMRGRGWTRISEVRWWIGTICEGFCREKLDRLEE